VLVHAAGQLAPYKQPRRVRFVEELPRNALGKVLRHQL
jgi:acyl-coenzyme A synthetase/AMP-(fatty) acid ligase